MTVVFLVALSMQTLASDGAPSEILDVASEIAAPAPEILSPHQYLYTTYPTVAQKLDCVIRRESQWIPSAQNPRSSAAGLAQILLSTWLSTPPGQRGESRYNAYSNIDGAAWLVTDGGGWRHWAATAGGC